MTEFFFGIWQFVLWRGLVLQQPQKRNFFCDFFFVHILKTKLLYFTSKKIYEICIPTLRSFVKLQSLENWCSGKLIKKNLFAMHFFAAAMLCYGKAERDEK